MNFYQANFELALARVSFPNKEIYRHWLTFYERGLAIWTQFDTPNFDLPFSEAIETKEMALRHKKGIFYSDIPTNDKQAIDFFVEKIFLLYLEIQTHEAMESFAVDDRRFVNPHERGLYEGARPDVEATSKNLWRNHVMWEACALVAQPYPPDYRSVWEQILDDIVDWDLKMERLLKWRLEMLKHHFYSWRAIVKIKFEGWNVLDAARYSLGMIQVTISSLISGQF